jgi:hypothetical protein
VIAESNLQLDRFNSVFGRVEYVRKSAEELAVQTTLGNPEFGLGALVLGYIREFAAFSGATLGIGARGALNRVPRSLQDLYGGTTPAGLAVFLRVRPALLDGSHMMHDMDGM